MAALLIPPNVNKKGRNVHLTTHQPHALTILTHDNNLNLNFYRLVKLLTLRGG